MSVILNFDNPEHSFPVYIFLNFARLIKFKFYWKLLFIAFGSMPFFYLLRVKRIRETLTVPLWLQFDTWLHPHLERSL